MPKAPENLRDFSALLKVVEFLRGPDGCPWDKEQTHQSLTRFAIEEAHELADAIDSGNSNEIREELGDLLLQVLLHSEIARQEGLFDISDVIEVLNSKMIRRHPHVFGDVKVKNSNEVIANWTEIKAQEKGKAKEKLAFDIPAALPALIRAQKIGEKTEKIGFDWETVSAVWDKVNEEIGELAHELKVLGSAETAPESQSNVDRVAAEIGDVFFSLAQLARHMGLDAEQTARNANQRFESRFKKMQELVTQDGKSWGALTTQEKEAYWGRAKKALT